MVGPAAIRRRFGLAVSVFLAWEAMFGEGVVRAQAASISDGTQAGETTAVTLPGDVPLDLAWIPAGEFLMGQSEGERDAYANKETPRHRVTLTRGYWMGACEVTQEQWRAVMGTEPWSGHEYVNNDPKSPAVFITWNDARAFAERLSQLTGQSFRLPTEAEWEYACRAGTTTRFYWGDDPNYEAIDRHAWWRGTTWITDQKQARAVGAWPANPWGLHDMSGNVSEWCQDWHWFYTEGPDVDPVGPSSASHRVLRGGGWVNVGGHCRSSRRNHEEPTAATSHIGFRIVCGPAPERQPGSPEIVDVFVAGQDGVNTYRIPSLVLAPDGSLLAFCEARKESQADASPTDMVLRRSEDSGRTWQPMQVLVAGQGSEALMNPCPVVDRTTGTIVLLCVNINKISPDHHQQFILTSPDSGRTWSQPVDMKPIIANHDDRFVPGPGVGVQMANGRLVVPGYVGQLNSATEEDFYSCVLYSDDHGKTWAQGPTVPQCTDESQAVELADGRLMLNMRGDMGMSCRGVAISENGGESWASFRWDRQLNECPCQGSIVRYSLTKDGGKNRLLFANPDNHGELFNVVERTRMTVRMSYDEGETWPVKKLIHPGPASYSSLIHLPDGEIGLLFEGGEKHRREWIRFVRFSLDWLTDGADRL